MVAASPPIGAGGRRLLLLTVDNGGMSAATTARSIGIEVKGGAFVPLIPVGTPVPARHSEIFTTADDDQPSIQVTLLAGDRSGRATERIGRFEILIDPAPRGYPQVEVTIAVDGWQQVTLTASERGRALRVLAG